MSHSRGKAIGRQLFSCWGVVVLVLVAAAARAKSPLDAAALLGETVHGSGKPAAWLAYGDWRGQLEPCGCDPATDLGGVKRIAATVERERALNGDFSIYDLGNALPASGKEQLKIVFILEAQAALTPTAILWNVLEMREAEKIAAVLGRLPDLAKRLPYVSSHRRERSAHAGLSVPSLERGEELIYGFAEDRASGLVEPLGPSLLARWRQELAARPTLRKVLLFSGSDASLRTIVDAQLFDVIVSSNPKSFDVAPGSREADDENGLVRDAARDIVAVPLGGQGILRGGLLRTSEARPVADYLKASSCDKTSLVAGQDPACAPAGQVPVLSKIKLFSWLPADVGGQNQLADLFQRYAQASAQSFRAAGALRLADLKQSPFATASACQGCHPKAYEAWTKSRHAEAFKTLQIKKKEEDAECVSCHVVGASAKGGFVSFADSPHLANVQCENCHGPRLEHMANPKVRHPMAGKAFEACKDCHNAVHSPKFDRALYWQRIEHR